MRIVFVVGNDRERTLYRAAGRGVRVAGVIAARTQHERLASWRTACQLLGVPYREVDRKGATTAIQELEPALLVSIGFPYILLEELLQRIPLALNVHPTLLPKYRGPRTAYYILANNEDESGVTIHRMTAQVDAGDIVGQQAFALSPFDTPASMMRKSREVEADLLADVLEDLAMGHELTFTPQDESQVSEFMLMRTPEHSVLDPTRPLLELYPHIRACDPDKYPAFFELKGQRVCIRLWRANKPAGEEDMI